MAGCDDVPEPPPPPPVDYAMVCVDPRTHNRVEDDLCRDAAADFTTPPGMQDDTDVIVFAGGHNYGWYYYGADRGLTAPGVGGRVKGGSFTTPKLGGGVRPPVVLAPKTGGVVQRGGFGVPSGSTGGKGGSAGVKGGGSAGT